MSEENKKGCFFWGCLTVIVVFIIIVILMVVGYYKVKNTLTEFTSPTPVEIVPVEYSKEEKTETLDKIKNFGKAIKEGKETVSEEFTDKDLNIFIDSRKELKGKTQVTFEDNKIKAKLNVPLKGVPLVGGRYLAGDAEMKVTCKNGKLDINIISYKVNGKPVPEDMMKELRKTNIADRLYNDPKAGPIVKRIKDLQIKDNKLCVDVDPK